MHRQTKVGNWRVDWEAGWIASRRMFWRSRLYLEPRTLAVLRILTERAGRVVSVEDILEAVWPDRVVGRDSVSTAVYQLRQQLGDGSQRSNYIKTEARRGYRLICPVADIERSNLSSGVVSIATVAVLAVMSVGWILGNARQPALPTILVEQLNDHTEDVLSKPLHDAIGSTLLGELISQLPGQVVLPSSPVDHSLTLESHIVSCDLGPALVINLVHANDQRYLWSQAYPLEDWVGGTERPTLVQRVAGDVSVVVDNL